MPVCAKEHNAQALRSTTVQKSSMDDLVKERRPRNAVLYCVDSGGRSQLLYLFRRGYVEKDVKCEAARERGVLQAPRFVERWTLTPQFHSNAGPGCGFSPQGTNHHRNQIPVHRWGIIRHGTV